LKNDVKESNVPLKSYKKKRIRNTANFHETLLNYHLIADAGAVASA
jgi:hypothetical protein